MRIVMMGTGGFAVPVFGSLLTSNHEVLALVTRPPRGRKPPPNPLRKAAEAAGVPIVMPDSINSDESMTYLSTLASDLFVVCDYGQILSADTLGLARLGGINLHGSLLPAYRGAAPVHWAMYDGCRETGVTVIHMTPRLDAGPCLAKVALSIEPHENAIDLEHRLAKAGVELVLKSINQLEHWDGKSPIGEIQDQTRASKAPRLKKSDGNVDWSRNAQQIYDQFRAFTPWPGTFTFWHRRQGEPLRVALNDIAVASLEDTTGDSSIDSTLAQEMKSALATPGTAIVAGKRLFVATGNGAVEILKIQPAGKKPIETESFLRGYPVAFGDRFGSQDLRACRTDV